MARPTKYSPELRERAVRMVQEHAGEYPSQWAAIRSVGETLGCSVEALRRWLRQAERDAGRPAGLTTDERQRLRQLERDNFELKRANEILRQAARFLPRRSSTAERNDGRLHRRAAPRVRSPGRAPLLWGACSAASMEVCLDENEERHGVRERNRLDSRQLS
jgi:transposase